MGEEALGHPKIRFEATVHGKREDESASAVADLDLDRIPGPEGEIRILATSDDLARLLDAGFEARLVRAHRVKPLDPSLVMDDAEARKRMEEQTGGISNPGRR